MGETNKSIRETIIIDDKCQEHFLPLSSPRLNFLREHGVSFSGISVLRGKYEIRRRTNNAHLIHYTLAGSGWLLTDCKKTVLKPGQVWISPEGTAQEYGLKGKSWEILWFDLKDQSPWSVIKDFGTCIRESVLGRRFKHILDSTLWENQTSGLHANRIIQLLSESILLYLERELDIQYDSTNHTLVSKLHLLFSKVRAQVQYPWSVEKLADESELFISPEHFGRLCVQHLGVSPMRMVGQLRMEKARELLRSTSIPIKNVAEQVGYQNYFAFLTAFKRCNGKSPRQFRYNVLP
jgi:AraC-like DNA-binding protein